MLAACQTAKSMNNIIMLNVVAFNAQWSVNSELQGWPLIFRAHILNVSFENENKTFVVVLIKKRDKHKGADEFSSGLTEIVISEETDPSLDLFL